MSTVFYVHSGLPTTCPPTKVTTVKRTKHVKKRKVLPFDRRGTQGYEYQEGVVPVPGLPEGYVFVPPPVPLTYPESYHLVDAGPMNEAPKIKRKRTVFGGITNVSERVTVLLDAVGTWTAIMGSGDGGGIRLAFNDFFSYSRANCLSDLDFFYEMMDVYGGEAGSLVEFASFPLVGRYSIFSGDPDSLSPQEAGVFRGVGSQPSCTLVVGPPA
ncbi:hypothetical protein C8R45DRAFT_922571 [Mycena sanguinolenta]|nr:hypothetical protein C8R45DRAFT_922571 [Mycena sanguinolenta]